MNKITVKKSSGKIDNTILPLQNNRTYRTVNAPIGKIWRLQRTLGNQAVQRLLKSGTLQAKLKIGKSGDKYEREADRVADIVMRMPEPVCPTCMENESIRRQPEKEGVQPKPLAEQITPLIQRQVESEEEEEEEPVQTKSDGPTSGGGMPAVESGINSLKGGGQPLPKPVRNYFEPRFGWDFSGVRVHTGSRAVNAARSINAKAFTQGRDVVFGAGQYSPDTSGGKSLLAHELTHVVQQRKNPVFSQIQRKPGGVSSCSDVKVFTEFDMPFPISNQFFEENTWLKENVWEKKLESAAKGKCKVERDFDDIKLAWNFNNPNLGTYYGKDLNKGSVEIDIEPKFIYSGKPCCECFAGTVSWDFTVKIKRNRGTKSGKPESGIQSGIKGSKSAGECEPPICCSLTKNYTVNLGFVSEKKNPEVEAYFSGTVKYSGKIFKDD